MSRDDRYCPACGARFTWYEETCDDCGANLVDRHPGGDPAPDASLVPVFQSVEAGAIDLARVTLEQEGIECVARNLTRRSARWLTTLSGGGQAQAGRRRAVRAGARCGPGPWTAGGPPNEAGPMPAGGATASTHGASRPAGIVAILLHDAERGTFIGRISNAQLDILVEHLEQESEQDRSYYVDAATIEMLAAAGADETLVIS